MQEAVHLAPDEPAVKDAFKRLQLDDEEHVLLKLCTRFVTQGQEEAGQEALRYINAQGQAPTEIVRSCTKLVLSGPALKYLEIRDGILSGLVRQSVAAKTTLAERLNEKTTTAAFEDVYMIGDGAAAAIATVVLSPEAWVEEGERARCEKDVFQLFMAKLLEVGDDNDSRAMRGICRLLTTDASKLHALIDEETFDAILACLDYRNSLETKSPAILATAKFLEASENTGQEMLTKYVISHYARQTTEDLVLAFSAAAGVFSIATPIASAMFLTKDFLPSLVPLLEKKVKSKHVSIAALEMLSAACVDSACREGVHKHCLEWVQSIAKSEEEQKASRAAVILAKIHGTSGQSNGEPTRGDQSAETDALVHQLTQMLFEAPKRNRNAVFEGLAHQSVRSSVKQKLVSDKRWLQIFMQELRQADTTSPAIFGGLTIVDNLTAHLPVLSEEQKRMAQLKAYANAAPSSTQPDPLNDERIVSARCKSLVDAGIVSAIVEMQKQLSPSCVALSLKIMLSLTRASKTRGTIAQQGGVKMLASSWSRLEGNSTQAVGTKQITGQALARVLISVDPSVLFGKSGNALLQTVVSALLFLLYEENGFALEGPRDLLPTFEALLALTNLTSVPSNGSPSMIIKSARAKIEDLMLSNNENLRRAATELMSNLVQHPDGIVLFADATPEAAKRLHILLALSGSEDVGTRKAAGGALAVLTGFSEVLDAINKQDRGMELLLGMLDDESDEMIHRGVVCVTEIMGAQGSPAQAAREQMRKLGIREKLEVAKAQTQSPDISNLLSDALGSV